MYRYFTKLSPLPTYFTVPDRSLFIIPVANVCRGLKNYSYATVHFSRQLASPRHTGENWRPRTDDVDGQCWRVSRELTAPASVARRETATMTNTQTRRILARRTMHSQPARRAACVVISATNISCRRWTRTTRCQLRSYLMNCVVTLRQKILR